MKAIPLTIIAVSLFANACGRKAENPPPATETAPIVSVPLAKVSKAGLGGTYDAVGTVRAKSTTNVSATTMGRITSLPFVEGDTVTRGQTLVTIDNRESQAQLKKAQAGLEEARAAIVEIDKSATAAEQAVKTAESQKELAEQTFARYKELFERRSASAQEFDEAKSRVKTAASEVERAKLNVDALRSKKQQIDARMKQARADIENIRVFEDYSRIAAPVSGVIVKKFVEMGAVAAPGAPLLAIEDSSQYRLEASVEESKSKLIRVGTRAAVTIDALGGGGFYGSVAEILPSADAASRTYTVKIDLPANPLLKTGLYGVASFPQSATSETLAVAQTALVTRGQLVGVYVVAEGGLAQFRIVTTGKTSDGLTEILSGLAEGDEYVSADASKVVEGAKVK